MNDDLQKDLEENLENEEEIELEENEDLDDVSDDDISDMDDSSQSTIKKLKEKLKTVTEEKQKYLDSWQRDKAEFINSRKRDQDDKAQFMKFAEENLINEMIPVLDSFELAMGNKEAWEKVDKNWRVGVEYIYSQLSNTLAAHGLIKIDPIGKAFDPKEHHSVDVIDTKEEANDHMVMEVVSYGYLLNGKVIKAAQVKVGEFVK